MTMVWAMAKKTDNNGKVMSGSKSWQIKPGEIRNPNGRPKGSRNKFAEEFLKDFLRDWELNGKKAIRQMRKLDPVAYVKVGASILPKDFNISHATENDLEKYLEQFDDEQLEAIFAAIAAAGQKDTAKKKAGEKSESVH